MITKPCEKAIANLLISSPEMDSRLFYEVLRKPTNEGMSTTIQTVNDPVLIEEAGRRWITYQPQEKKHSCIAIDGSEKPLEFQGVIFYAVTAVAVDYSNNIIDKQTKIDFDVISIDAIKGVMTQYESEVLKKILLRAPSATDTVISDASLVALLNNTIFTSNRGAPQRRKSFLNVIRENIKKNDRCPFLIFITKNSKSKRQFEGFNNSRAGDIYYFNKVANTPGYTKPYTYTDFEEREGIKITEVYFRLNKNTTMLKLEIVDVADAEPFPFSQIHDLLDKLVYRCIDGYPYCLKLAHECCKITLDDIKRIARYRGYYNEPNGREMLE